MQPFHPIPFHHDHERRESYLSERKPKYQQWTSRLWATKTQAVPDVDLIAKIRGTQQESLLYLGQPGLIQSPVPGATGLNPEPPPKAKKKAGCWNINLILGVKYTGLTFVVDNGAASCSTTSWNSGGVKVVMACCFQNYWFFCWI